MGRPWHRGSLRELRPRPHVNTLKRSLRREGVRKASGGHQLPYDIVAKKTTHL